MKQKRFPNNLRNDILTNVRKIKASNLRQIVCGLMFVLFLNAGISAQTNIPGPAGSGRFGEQVTVLPNGNFVVVDTQFDLGATPNVGAVYLYNGETRQIISTLTGSTAHDLVGFVSGVTVLSNGNFVVRSFSWSNGTTQDVGAVTWCSGTTGCNGTVSAANSLIGGTAGDQVGSGVVALTNGNYVVQTGSWNNPSPATADVGAVTWCNGTTGCTGLVTAANSLIGGTANDQVGGSSFDGASNVVALTNGNYVVRSQIWNNPSTAFRGAVTWCNGPTGCTGLVTAANSLISGTANDNVGNASVTALTNGNYVVGSGDWDNPSPATMDVGAVTFCSGATGCNGTVTAANSLIGGTQFDQIGSRGVTALTNGNYIVRSPLWNNPSPVTADVGAATLCSGATGCNGMVVSAANSLIGSTTNDNVGSDGATAFTNGNYVVVSSGWDNPSPVTADVGAATLCSGATGCNGMVVSATNSLIGSTVGDQVGLGFRDRVTAFANGDYVVASQLWDNPSPVTADVGAATFCSGATGCNGMVVSAANSLIGGAANSFVGSDATALTNGNYVVVSEAWSNPSPAMMRVGAVTWCNGTTGCNGMVVSAANSLIGGSEFDRVGNTGVTALANGNYVVGSFGWHNPAGPILFAGAVTLGNGTSGTVGTVSASNSVVGTVSSGISGFSYDATRNRLFVGRGNSNIVTIVAAEAAIRKPPFDFDGDGKTDISIFRPAPAEWWILKSSNGGNTAAQFGQSTDKLTPGDFTGDGKTDIAFWRPVSGFWFVLRSEDNSFYSFPFGASGDIPAPADYDGDNKTDAAVFRPSNSTWYISQSSGGTTIQQFGQNGDVPAVADYDGDGRADIAIYRVAQGEWWIQRSTAGLIVVQFGTSSDKPVQGDYTGDSKSDVAFFRPTTGEWFVLRSEDQSFYSFPFGISTDIPAPGDYDGDGRFDATVFRPSNTTWYSQRSTAGTLIQSFGLNGDIPVPSAFVPLK